MVSGSALVATNVGCIPECTIPGKTALVVEPGDQEGMIKHIADLIENPQKIEQIGNLAKEYIKQFTWENSASKLELLFKGYQAKNKVMFKEISVEDFFSLFLWKNSKRMKSLGVTINSWK